MHIVFRSGRLLAVAFATYFAAGCGSSFLSQSPPETTGKAVEASSELRLADVQLRVGRAAFDQGSLGTALDLFEKAHKSAPNDARPLVGRGDVLFAQRRFGEAETAYRAATARDPGLFEAQEGLGKALVSTQRYEEGLHAFEAALAIRPEASLLNKIGVTHEMLGHGETAQKFYRDSLALEADSLTARNNLALSLGVSGSYDAALKEMEKVVASPAASERHQANLAFIYGLSGRSMETVPPQVAHAAATKGWDDAFFARTREVAKTGDRTALLALLNNPRAAAADPQFPPMAALPEMPETESESVEKPDPAPVVASVPADMPAETATPAPASGSPTVLVPLSPVLQAATSEPATPEAAAAEPAIPEATESDSAMAAVPAEPAEAPALRQMSKPESAQITEKPAEPARATIQTAMRTPSGPVLQDDPNTLGLEVPAATAAVAPGGPFHVQLGAFRKTRWLSAMLTKLSADAKDLLPESRLDVASHNGMYKVRSTGLPTRAAATQLCSDLQSRKFDCFVTGKGGRSAGRTLDIASAGDPEAIRRFVAQLPEIKAAMAVPAAPAEPAAPHADPGMAPPPGQGAVPAPDGGTAPNTEHAMTALADPAPAPAPSQAVAPGVHPETETPANTAAAAPGPVEAPAIVPPPPPPPSDIVAAIRRGDPAPMESPVGSGSAEAASPVKPATPKQGGMTAQSGEYRVQLAAYRLARHLARGVSVLKKSAGDLLPPLERLTRSRPDAATAIPFRLRSAPLESRAAAEDVCRKLSEKGVECLVIRHGAGYWRPMT